MQSNLLIMHIGLHKTGTTALQEFLSLNRDQLARHGIVYGTKNHLLSECWPSDDDSDSLVAERWENTRQAIASATSETVLVSNESLSTRLYGNPARIDQIRQYVGSPRIKVILYLRRQDTHLESMYRQAIRGGKRVIPFGTSAIDELFHPNYYDYETMVDFFAEQFGKENIIVRCYDKKAFVGGNLFTDFADALGIQWDDSFKSPPRGVNTSMDARLMEFMLRANATLPEEGGQLREFKELIDVVEKLHFTPPENKLLTPRQRIEFLRSCEAGNNAVAVKYLGKDGPLFSPPTEAQLSPPEQLTFEDLYDLILRLNDCWCDGLGAVPFPVYNYLKMQHLKRKIRHAPPLKKGLLSLQLALHGLLHGIKLYVVPTRWPGKSLKKTIMRYITKDIILTNRKKG